MSTVGEGIEMNETLPKVNTSTGESFFEQPINTISVKIKDLSNLGPLN